MMSGLSAGGNLYTRLYKIPSTFVAQAMQSTQQANGMFATKQKAKLMGFASILGTVSARLATDALCVLAWKHCSIRHGL